MVGAPTKPTAVAVPVTSPARESGRGREERRGGGGGGRTDSVISESEKLNFETMSCPPQS